MKNPLGNINYLDITAALRGWSFQPGQVNVRMIRGSDGKPKLQLRLDLGLLQMELNGRPDGKRPHRSATELDYHRRKLQRHLERHGSDDSFALTAHDCQALREESAMFYHRYLSLFVLEQYPAVIRDTQHNLDVLDICARYGRTQYDRMCLEQYRPYIVMMHARANACAALRQGFVRTAMAYLHGGLKKIARLFPRPERRQLLRHSHEAAILHDMLKQIRQQLPPDPRTLLRERLRVALAAERYEEAACLRDELAALQSFAGTTGMISPPAEPARRPRKARRPKDSTPKHPDTESKE